MTQKRILIVEDDGIIASHLQHLLMTFHYSVVDIVTSVEESIQQAIGVKPDLILMDIELAGEMNGVQAAKYIREQLGTPVVYLTAYSEDALLQQAKITEPFGYLIKPVQSRELKATLEIAFHNHHLEEEVKKLNRELEQRVIERTAQLENALQQEVAMRAELIQSEKMAALGRLAASIAHEINNPLTAIQSCLTLLDEELQSRARPDRLARYIDTAKSEIESIAGIVRRMREFYRPLKYEGKPVTNQAVGDSSAHNLQTSNFYRFAEGQSQWIDLHILLENVLQLSATSLSDCHINVKRKWMVGLPLVKGRADALKQVFLNLILNATDAMKLQGGVLQISTGVQETHIQENPPQSWISIEFSDTGHGIPPDVLDHLFEPFFTTKTHGSGLGLSTSYQIITAHHGQIKVSSQVGVGTTFTILLPNLKPDPIADAGFNRLPGE